MGPISRPDPGAIAHWPSTPHPLKTLKSL